MGIEKYKVSPSEDRGGTAFQERQWSNAAQVLGRVETWPFGIDRIVVLILFWLIVVSGNTVNSCKTVNELFSFTSFLFLQSG